MSGDTCGELLLLGEPVFLDMFLARAAEIVPYTRFLDARRRRDERVTLSATLRAVDPDLNVLLASTGTTAESAAVVATTPGVVPDPDP